MITPAVRYRDIMLPSIQNTPSAVSYTHLDVYKRQGLLIGALFGTVYVRQGLAGKMGNVVGAFVGCTVIQLLIMVIVVFLQLA